jgi:hypothetical protein
MIESARRRELRESIDRLLAEDTKRRRLDERSRVDWLSHHLALYVGRLAGFAALPNSDALGPLDHALFDAVDVGGGRRLANGSRRS